jgi:hypothetical protein
MDFSYVVLLKPSEIRFTTNFVRERFDNNILLTETLTQLQNGEVFVDDIPFIEVIWYQEKWEWYTVNNRRLWVFQQLEKSGQCKLIKTHRIEKVEHICDYPAILYGSANLRIKEENHCRKVSVLPSKWNSQRAEENSHKNRRGSFEYRELKVSIEKKYSAHHGHTSGYESYQETCTVSEYKSRHRQDTSRKSRGRCRRSRYRSPYKKSSRSSLVKLEPSHRYVSRAREVQKFKPRSTREAHGPVYGIVSYGFWQRRRTDFLQRVYSFRTGRLKDPGNLANVMFTCGVCYKSFRTRVSLEQHSEELMHFACVRCGKFFTSSTALGQHRIALTHYVY